MDQYKYLGIWIGHSGSFAAAKKHIAEQGNKSLFALIKKVRNLSLPIDIQIDLFEKKKLNQFFYIDVRFGVLGVLTL